MRTLLLVFVVTLSSCGDQANKGSLSIPQNNATAEEQQKIDSALNDIDDLFRHFGTTIDWSKIPIVVNDTKQFSAYCQRDSDGTGKFIAISSDTLSQEASSATVPPYWPTLLHEIGHCFFGREHETNVLFFAGYNFEFQEVVGNKVEIRRYSFVPVSVMNDDYSIAIPFSLRKYYAAEILGLTRAIGIEDLKKFSTVNLVKK